MTKKLLLFNLLLTVAFNSFSQEGGTKVMKQFNRPSVNYAFLTPQSNVEQSLIAYFGKLPVPARFDNRKSDRSVVSNEAQTPALTYAQQSRDIIANIWGRDSRGNFSMDEITKAAMYSATDGQALTSGASKDNMKVYTEIADNLLKSCFIVAYDFAEIQTYEQYYDAQDAKRRKAAEKAKTTFTPVARTQEGWVVKYNCQIYKLTWNDSISNIFYNDLWVDQSTGGDRAERLNKFNQFVFPLERVYGNFLPEMTISSQSNDPKTYESGLIKRLSMEELLSRVPELMQDNVIFKSSKKIDEFKMRAAIFNSYPTQAKLGSKEGLYIDQRFFVYSIKLNKKGNEKKVREAVVRAYEVSNNSKVATGDMVPSNFRQQGGKNIYSGYLLEMKEDRGIDIMLGTNIGNGMSNGFYLGLDYRLSALTKKSMPTLKAVRGFYFSLGISATTQTGIQLFELTENGKDYINNADPTLLPVIEQEYADLKYDCSSFGLYAGLSKELYLTKRGRISLSPELGVGIFSTTATPVGGGTAYDLSTIGVTLGSKLAINLLPSFEIFAKPMLNYTLPSSAVDFNTSGELLTSAALYGDYINGAISTPLERLSVNSGYQNSFKINFPITIGIRLKF